ncbi:MAG TPA: MoaD/ThiS family protein [Tepidisphaeraceae bacterium]|jgi:molybdopterin converting factor small subunit|nr:MoaD/ThiS family protein [Tepidisphaeraceae bacterium]
MIRVIIPGPLQALAGVEREVKLDVAGVVTQRSVLDALEAEYPKLRGTIRDQVTQTRRPLVRFFACGEDVSHDGMDAPLPGEVASGKEAFYIIAAIAGGLGRGPQDGHPVALGGAIQWEGSASMSWVIWASVL